MCGLAPSRVLGALSYVGGGWESASIRMLPTGKVEVLTGASAHGQGHETAFSQIVADRLGVAFEDVEVLHGDTQIAHKGLDTYGSRSLVVGGIAIVNAADKVIEKARPIAAHLLEASEDDLEFVGGRFGVRGTDQGVTLGELSFAVFQGHNLPDGVEPTLDADATFDPENFSYPHGTHLCAAEVDTETGAVKLRSYVCVDDIGEVINPLIVEGQVHGGLAQGIAQALFEEAVHDDQGTLTTATFVDYLLPTAADLPHFTTDRTTTAEHHEPVGGQGRRRGRHHRLDARRGQRGDRRGAAPRGRRHRDAAVAATGLAGPPGRLGRRVRRGCRGVPALGRAGPVRRRRTLRHQVRRRREPGMIPAAFDYHAPTSVDEALQLLATAAGEGKDVKVLGGGQSLIPVLRLRMAAPEVHRRPRADRRPGRHPGRRRRDRDRRDGHPRHGAAARAGPPARAAHRAGHRDRRGRRRCGTAARSAARWCTPTRRATCRRRRSRWAAQMVIAGRRRCAQNRCGGGLLRGPVHHRGRRGRAARAGAGAQAHRLGRLLREVQPHLARLVDGARPRWRCGSRAARSPRPGSALTNMGSVPVRAAGVEAALVGQQATSDAVRTACAAAGDGTSPPDRRERRRRLPSSPRGGADRPGRPQPRPAV